MSDIAKSLYEKTLSEFLEGCSTIEELGEMYGHEGEFHAYLLILNPNHSEYEDKLTKLEVDYHMSSGGTFINTKAGFIKELGENASVGMFSKEDHADHDMSSDKIRELLGEVLFDIYKIK